MVGLAIGLTRSTVLLAVMEDMPRRDNTTGRRTTCREKELGDFIKHNKRIES